MDVVVARIGVNVTTPIRSNYRLLEWNQQRGRWIAPDIGYYDDGYFGHQLWFAGGGAELLHRKRLVWSEELYLYQAVGKGTRNERGFWFWTVFDFNLHRRLTAEVVVYPTLPLDQAQNWGFDIDRSKLEWQIGRNWRIGPGYAGTSFGSHSDWESRPFATATRSAGVHSVELWLERYQNGAQMQVRYMLVCNEK